MKIRAIVLDDDYTVRSVISDILEDRGYEVFGSSEPLFCPIYLNYECTCPYGHICTTIIITDINMPNMTGLEFIEHQKRNGCKVRNVAVMSGKWTDEELEHAKRLGCRTFNKPFKVGELKKWLDACEGNLDPNTILSDLPLSRQVVLSD